jgi:hypothetical protein
MSVQILPPLLGKARKRGPSAFQAGRRRANFGTLFWHCFISESFVFCPLAFRGLAALES